MTKTVNQDLAGAILTECHRKGLTRDGWEGRKLSNLAAIALVKRVNASRSKKEITRAEVYNVD